MNMDMNKNTQTIKKIHLTDRNGNFMVVNYVPNQVTQNESFRNSFHKHSSNALLVFFALSREREMRWTLFQDNVFWKTETLLEWSSISLL